MDGRIDACKEQRRPAVSTVRELVDHDMNASCQYERHESPLTFAGWRKELRVFDRELSTICNAWCLRERRCLRQCITSAHTTNRWQGKRIQLDSREDWEREIGNTSRRVLQTYLKDELAEYRP